MRGCATRWWSVPGLIDVSQSRRNLTSILAQRTTDTMISAAAKREGLQVEALSSYCMLPNGPTGLLFGYAAFDDKALSDGAARIIDILRSLDQPSNR